MNRNISQKQIAALTEATRSSASAEERQVVRDFIETTGGLTVLRGDAAVEDFKRNRATHMWQGHYVEVLPDLIHGEPCQHDPARCQRIQNGGRVEIWGDWFGGKWVQPTELSPLAGEQEG